MEAALTADCFDGVGEAQHLRGRQGSQVLRRRVSRGEAAIRALRAQTVVYLQIHDGPVEE